MHAGSHPTGTPRPASSGMRQYAQIVGGVVLGLGLASAVGLDSGLDFAGFTVGLGVLLVCLGLLMPEGPGDTTRAGRP